MDSLPQGVHARLFIWIPFLKPDSLRNFRMFSFKIAYYISLRNICFCDKFFKNH